MFSSVGGALGKLLLKISKIFHSGQFYRYFGVSSRGLTLKNSCQHKTLFRLRKNIKLKKILFQIKKKLNFCFRCRVALRDFYFVAKVTTAQSQDAQTASRFIATSVLQLHFEDFFYLSIWIDSKSIVRDTSVVLMIMIDNNSD